MKHFQDENHPLKSLFTQVLTLGVAHILVAVSETVAEEETERGSLWSIQEFRSWHISLGCRSEISSLVQNQVEWKRLPSRPRSTLPTGLGNLMDTCIQSFSPRKYVLGSLFGSGKEYSLLHQTGLHKPGRPGF